MTINFDNLEAVINDYFYCEESYRHLSARYFRAHGHGVNLDRVKTDEEKRVSYAYHEREKAYNAFWSIGSVFGFDRDQFDRLVSAFRALTRWYEKHQWMDCPSAKMKRQLLDYIFEG